MKMTDGGYRPAYNVQFATDHDSDVIVGVAVTNASDQQELVPMLTQVERASADPTRCSSTAATSRMRRSTRRRTAG